MTNFRELIFDYALKLGSVKDTAYIVNFLLHHQIIKKVAIKGEEPPSSEELEKKFQQLPYRDQRRVKKLTGGMGIVPKALLIGAVSIYDAFLANLLSEVVKNRKEMLGILNKNIPLTDLVEFPSIEEAIQSVIWRQIDDILRQSHYEQLEWIESKTDLRLTAGNRWLPDFIEVTERRNLFVHADGFVNLQYLRTCEKYGFKTKGTKEKDLLDCSPEYYNNAISTLQEFGFLLAQSVWRKIFPAEIPEANNSLNSFILEAISDGEYQQAIRVSEYFKKSLKSQFSEEDLIIMDINLAQAYKWAKDAKGLEKILKARSWKAYNRRYKIAYHCLADELDVVIQLLENLEESDKIGQTDFEEWPLFQELRKSDRFLAWFEKKYSRVMVKIDNSKI